MFGEKMYNMFKESNIKFQKIKHQPAYTAQQTAELSHISGKYLAKTVIVKVDKEMKMVVLPANFKINMTLLQRLFHSDKIYLATESEINKKFDDCEVGAMPPFGNLYGIDVLVSKELTKDKEIYFNAGTHTDLVKMLYADYRKVTKPTIADITLK